MIIRAMTPIQIIVAWPDRKHANLIHAVQVMNVLLSRALELATNATIPILAYIHGHQEHHQLRQHVRTGMIMIVMD